jgi:DNA-binding transcriptional MerR regulator
MKSSQYYLTSEVSHELSCSVATVRAMERAGKLRPTRTPSGTRIFLADDVAKVKTERERQNQSRA